jgi:hypothetical protein
VLPEADEVTGGGGVFPVELGPELGGQHGEHVDAAVVAGIADWLVPGRRRGPIARLFSGPRRFDRLCGGRLRCVMVG